MSTTVTATGSNILNPSAMLADSLAEFSKAAYQAFTELESQSRQETTRALAETRELKAERDKSVRDVHTAQLEAQSWRQELAGCKAALAQAELTITHQNSTITTHLDTIAQLRREVAQWKDQSRNWQEHFLRVEQERCKQSSRIDELVTGVGGTMQFIRPSTADPTTLFTPTPRTPKYTHTHSGQISSAPSSTTTKRHSIPSPTQPPAYKSPDGDGEDDAESGYDDLRMGAEVHTSHPHPHPNRTAPAVGSGSTSKQGKSRPVNKERDRERERDAQPDIQELVASTGKKPRRSNQHSGATTVVANQSQTHASGSSSTMKKAPKPSTSSNTQSQSQTHPQTTRPAAAAATPTAQPSIRSSTVIRRVQAVVHVNVKREEGESDYEGEEDGHDRTRVLSGTGAVAVKKRKKEESIDGAVLLAGGSSNSGAAQGHEKKRRRIGAGKSSKRVLSDDEEDEELDGEDELLYEDDEGEGVDGAGEGTAYNLRRPSNAPRLNYREEEDDNSESGSGGGSGLEEGGEDDEDEDELMLGSEDNHDEAYGTYRPVDPQSKSQNQNQQRQRHRQAAKLGKLDRVKKKRKA